MFINSNNSFQRIILRIVHSIRRAIFNAAAHGEYRGRTQTDRRARGAQKSFLKANNLNNNKKGNEAIL